MNDRLARDLERDTVRWLAAGPDRAPSGLLASTLERSGATRQRPWLIATALGTPSLGGTWRAATPLRVAIVAALALAGLVAAVVIVGMRDSSRLVVLPTPGPSAGPQVTPAPNEPSAAASAPDFRTGFAATIVQDTADPWVSVRQKPTENPRRPFAANQLEVFYGDCAECASTLRVDVTFGTVGDGVVVGWQPCRPETPAGLPCFIEEAESGGVPEFVQGTTTSELVSSWMARFGEATTSTHVARGAEWTILHYQGIVVALVVRLDQAVSVRIGPNPNLSAGRIETLVPHFLDLIMFDEPLPPSTAGPRVATIGDIELAIPAGWFLISGGPGLRLSDSPGDFLSMIQTIHVLDPGDEVSIARSSDEQSFTVTGATFDELVRSIDRGLADASRRDITVGGAPGYRWGIPQHAAVGPLGQMAAVAWKGRFYVFVVRYPLEGAPGDVLGPVLAGITLR